MQNNDARRTQTLIIGGGQAGLSVGYHLAKRGLPFLILDAHRRIGDAWRNRWDSLRLFTPARYAGLPGLPFRSANDVAPTKQEMADYLESYAKRFQLPVQTGVRVERLTRSAGRFVATCGGQRFESEQLVVAMSNFQSPRSPAFARELDPGITQLHSHHYRNPSQLQRGDVLIVGAGNSGADIALEVANTHRTWLSGKESGHIPFRIDSFLGRFLLVRVVRFIGHHILTVRTPIGRKLRPKMLHNVTPLVRVKPEDLAAAGVERAPRVVGVRNGKPLLADDRTLDVKNVIWCTGYEPGFSWIDLPIFDASGDPIHDRGIVANQPGMYFVGLHYLYSMTSATVIGIGRDAGRIADAIQARTRLTAAA
jgi:putative flavoprotein involved in K+ transport